jgi:hypothetical protein
MKLARNANIYMFINVVVKVKFVPIPVAARSKACVCGLSLAGIVGSNPAGNMDVCPL